MRPETTTSSNVDHVRAALAARHVPEHEIAKSDADIEHNGRFLIEAGEAAWVEVRAACLEQGECLSEREARDIVEAYLSVYGPRAPARDPVDRATGGVMSGWSRGWYADPDDPSRLRHWNGKRWAQRTRPLPSPPPERVPPERVSYTAVVGLLLAVGMTALVLPSLPAVVDGTALTVWTTRIWRASFVFGPMSMIVLLVAWRILHRAHGRLLGETLVALGLLAALVPPAYIAFWIVVGVASDSM